MKSAIVFPIRTANDNCWSWRSVDGEAEGKKEFAYYYDCVIDAQAKGYLVRLADAHGENAPDGESLPRTI
jgi:hypothetical protein